MAKNESTTTTNIPPGAAEMAGELENAFASADKISAQRVQNLQFVHQARAARLTREVAALKAEHAPDDEVKAAEAAVAASTFTASRVAVVQQQLTTPQPEVAAEGWALHGRVFDSNLKPLSGFTVFLVDAQKAFQKDYGFAYNDDTGYVLINYPGPDTATTKGEKSNQPRAASQTSTATAPSATTQPASAGTQPGAASPSGAPTQPSATQASTQPQLFLEIADTKAYPVYLSETPFQPVIASATYQNVTLAPGNKPIGDPPKEIRDIAMPAKRTNKPSPKTRK